MRNEGLKVQHVLSHNVLSLQEYNTNSQETTVQMWVIDAWKN